jgi:hypothetical protein
MTRRADERTTAHDEVGPHREVNAIDEEIFLLGSERRENARHALVAQE